MIHPALLVSAPVVIAVTVMGCYRPGLGELMNFTQIRHAKLWFAGQEQNWQLAQYEVDELQEGFDDVVRFHPSHKDSPQIPVTGVSVRQEAARAFVRLARR